MFLDTMYTSIYVFFSVIAAHVDKGERFSWLAQFAIVNTSPPQCLCLRG